MAELREPSQIESSLAAVRAVAATVSAIGAMARAQLPRVERAIAETATYLEWLDAVVNEVAGAPIDELEGATLTVVFGPERPFCGGLGRVVAAAMPAEGSVALVGTRLAALAQGALAEQGREPRFSLAGAAAVDELGPTTERVAEGLLGVLDAPSAPTRVQLLYPGALEPIRTLLLATRRSPRRSERDLYSPPALVAQAAARESVGGHLRLALTRALHAEVRMRAAAAERARRAADRRETELASELRVLADEQITAELAELAAGAQAHESP